MAVDKTALPTKQNIIDMLDAAGYGIAYWASTATVDAEAETYTVTEAEDEGETFTLTFTKLRETYWKLVDLEQGYCARWVHKYFLDSYIDGTKDGIEGGHIDGEAADVWIQVACWDKLVYG